MAFPLIPLLINIAIGIGVQVVGYLMVPRARKEPPEETRQMENPTATQGKPVGVIFGEVTVEEGNVLWSGDKTTRTRKIKA